MPALSSSDVPGGQALQAGTQLEEFIIEQVLGSGGFGITYLARDKRLGRQVVIKENLPAQFCWRDITSLTVQPRQSSGEDADNFQYSLESFEKEAATLASLDHPGIVKVLRSFEANGTAYFVMPFVEGATFDEVIKERHAQGDSFSEEELTGLLWRVLEALAYLHDRGIYHRDIKPGNLLITTQGDPVLIDFGAARQRLSERSLTVIESPGYTPFEQMQSRGKVGPWSDLYALGGTVYKAITGETPAKAADRILEDAVLPLAEHTELGSRYSRRLLQSVDRAMRPKFSERLQSAEEWTGNLRGSPSKAPHTTEPKQSVKKELSAERSVPSANPTNAAGAIGEAQQKSIRLGDLIWMWGGVVAIGLFTYLLTQNRAIQSSQPAPTAVDTFADASKPPQTAVTPGMTEAEIERRARELAAQMVPSTPAAPSATKGFTNTLGMTFVPVPGTQVQFCVHETRVADFAAFITESSSYDYNDGDEPYTLDLDGWKRRSGYSWKKPGFPQTDDHPVTCVSWEDAQAFCKWLSRKEAKTYRLPTDHEWSMAVGIGSREDASASPKSKDGKIEAVYPWNGDFSPSSVVGNYGGEESKIGKEPSSWSVIGGYRDGHARTAPVMSFTANKLGIHDLGGNLWEWCEDAYSATISNPVLRGGSWRGDSASYLLSSYRYAGLPGRRYDDVGFRLVLVVGSGG